jgi:hypothetical protein
MAFRKHAAIAVAATAAVVGSMATAATAAHGATGAPVPVVTIHVNNHRVLVGTNNTVHAGRTIFKVVTTKGDHIMNIARLHNGYTLAQAGADLPKAFGGDINAIHRIDRNIVFRGGAEARPNKSGAFSATLPAGNFVFLDQNSNKFAMVKVVGKIPQRQFVPNQSRISIFSYGFEPHPLRIPHEGWTLLTNKADQPHFVEFQHVKSSTTREQVRKFVKSGMQGQPSWALPGGTGSGVLSQGQHSALWLNLKPGKYLVACFWPDFRTGMPHIMMGMYRLVILT